MEKQPSRVSANEELDSGRRRHRRTALGVGAAAVLILAGGVYAAAATSSSGTGISTPMPKLLTAARELAVFHAVEAGNAPQQFSFNNSYVWGNLGIGPGSVTNFSGGSSLIGDCAEQPPASDPTKGCGDLEEHNTWTRTAGTYASTVSDLQPVVADVRATIDAVRSLAATEVIAGDLTAGQTVTSAGCGSVNVIRVSGEAAGGITISGCATDYFVFDVAGQYIGTGGQTVLSGVPASSVLWVFGGRLQNSGSNGIQGTALFDQPAANDAADNMKSFDGALYVLNGKLSLVSGGRVRWNPFTVFDYGDAPESYGTVYSPTSGAARHKLVSDGPSIGQSPASETDGPRGSTGTTDLDDGVILQPTYTTGQPGSIDVMTNNPSTRSATLNCWMDLDGNGTFDAMEWQSAPVAAGTLNGSTHFAFGSIAVPAGATTYVRCRVSTDAAAISQPVTPVPTGAPSPASGDPYFPYDKSSYEENDRWPDGEVEDYPLTISPPIVATTTTTTPTTTTTVPPTTTTTVPPTTTTTVPPTSTTTVSAGPSPIRLT